MKELKVAIVVDWIKDMWGRELVLSHIMEVFPEADIYTSVFHQKNNKLFEWKTIKTSFIQKILFFSKSHKLALFLRPYRFESFDLSGYDLVISSSSAESKGIITKPETIHICYCHTPTRYFWSHYHEYLNMMEFWFLNFFWKYLMPKIVHSLRIWDYVAAQRVDYFLANSINTKSRINKYYNKEAQVLYPWVDSSKFYISEKKDFYLYVWRVIPYKRFDLLVDTFNKNGKNLVIITNTINKLQKKLQKESKLNITWKINIANEEKYDLYSSAKWFLFPVDEDFWLVPVEAMMSWTPVIAYNKWWVLETVIPNETWIFFDSQSVRSLNNAITQFENTSFDYQKIREYAINNFDKNIFKQKLLDFIKDKI